MNYCLFLVEQLHGLLPKFFNRRNTTQKPTFTALVLIFLETKPFFSSSYPSPIHSPPGVILWELVTRQIPFADKSSFAIPVSVIKGERPSIPKTCPSALKKIIKSCWEKNPRNRPTITKGNKWNFVTKNFCEEFYEKNAGILIEILLHYKLT